MADEELCCGCTALDADADYDVGLHVAAIFILLAVSFLGTLLPILSTKLPFLSSRSIIMEWLMSFGFGVVIATGFIHMVNEGVEQLSDPCLGDIVEEYESLGLAVVLTTVVAMHLIECESAVFFAGKGDSLMHGHGHGHASAIIPSAQVATPNDEENPYQQKLTTDTTSASATATTARRQLAVILFELGVVFHSVIVGVDLGVTAGAEFKTLLAAICFHQFFEGIAISGSALSAMDKFKHVMALNVAFAVTTPIGIAVGMAIRTTYSASSVTALWVQGVLNCVAGGILLYTGLVELMTYQMTTNAEFLSRPGRQRLALYVGFWLGAGLMALIGKWA